MGQTLCNLSQQDNISKSSLPIELYFASTSGLLVLLQIWLQENVHLSSLFKLLLLRVIPRKEGRQICPVDELLMLIFIFSNMLLFWYDPLKRYCNGMVIIVKIFLV